MASVKASLPGQKVPVVDSNGMMIGTWYQFFQNEHNRTGGNPFDKVEQGVSDAQAALTLHPVADSQVQQRMTQLETLINAQRAENNRLALRISSLEALITL